MTEVTYEGPVSPRPLAPDAARLDGVTKTYGRGAGAVTELRDVTITLPTGSFTAVMGPSGSGKSTFMHCAAGLDRPTSGIVHLGEVDLTQLRELKPPSCGVSGSGSSSRPASPRQRPRGLGLHRSRWRPWPRGWVQRASGHKDRPVPPQPAPHLPGRRGQAGWSAVPVVRDPLLEAVDLHGAHDFRHTFATWLEDAGIPARVIDELMGHQPSGRAGRHEASAIGAHYRHTTPEMAARVVAAVEERLVVVLATAETALDRQPWSR